MENYYVFFTSEIEALKKEIKELKNTKEEIKDMPARKDQAQFTKKQKAENI